MKLITQVLASLLALVMPLGAKADETRTRTTVRDSRYALKR